MKRREFLTATAAVAVPGTAIAAPLVTAPVEDRWEPTAYFGSMGSFIYQKWVNAKTGEEDWRPMPTVESLVRAAKGVE